MERQRPLTLPGSPTNSCGSKSSGFRGGSFALFGTSASFVSPTECMADDRAGIHRADFTGKRKSPGELTTALSERSKRSGLVLHLLCWRADLLGTISSLIAYTSRWQSNWPAPVTRLVTRKNATRKPAAEGFQPSSRATPDGIRASWLSTKGSIYLVWGVFWHTGVYILGASVVPRNTIEKQSSVGIF